MSFRENFTPILIFATSRLIIVVVAYLAVAFLGHTMPPHAHHMRGTENLLLDVFGSRWDTAFYVNIVEEGYRNEGEMPSVAFFPLLPLLMGLLAPLVGDVVVAGILIANGALLGASLLFYRLVADQWGEPIAQRALWYLLIFPTAFFGSAIYTESLFLLASVGALFSARRGNWAAAGIFAVAAGLTRLIGLIVAPMLVLEWLRQRREAEKSGEWHRQETGHSHPGPPILQPGLAVLAAPAGLLAYMIYLWRAFGEPLAFAHASAAWNRVPRPPGQVIVALLQRPAGGWVQALRAGRLPLLNDWIDLGMVLFFLALALVLLYRQQWAEGIFVWLGVMLALNSGLLMSQRRYVCVLFPVYVLLAQWGHRPWADRAITGLFLGGQTLFVILFALWYWVA